MGFPTAKISDLPHAAAKSASDDTAEAASKRLGHADPKITERAYHRKAERAKPLR
jgi:integrase